MRAGKAIGVALAVLVAAALATVWPAQQVVAAGQQTGSQKQKVVEKPKVEDQTITVRKSTGGKPVVVTVEAQPGQAPKVMTYSVQGEPLMAALGGGPRLGVQIRDLGKEDLAKFKLSSQNGVVIDEVMKDSAAEKAGIKAGDVITKVGDESVERPGDITSALRSSKAGDEVPVTVVRSGKERVISVKVEQKPEGSGPALAPKPYREKKVIKVPSESNEL